jgi:hypothetical protein
MVLFKRYASARLSGIVASVKRNASKAAVNRSMAATMSRFDGSGWRGCGVARS